MINCLIIQEYNCILKNNYWILSFKIKFYHKYFAKVSLRDIPSFVE